MAVHLTPDELSETLGMSRREVVRLCREEAVPIYQGRIDKTLFLCTMVATGRRLPEGAQETLVSEQGVA